MSATSSLSSLPSEKGYAGTRLPRSPYLQSNPLPLHHHSKHARQRGNFSNFRKALRSLRNSHLDPFPPYFNNIMNNNRRHESLITRAWVSSTTIVGVSTRKKHDRGQYVYLLQPRFVEYRAGVAPRKSLKSLSDSEVRDAIFDDELTRTTPLPHLKGRGRWIFTFYQV